MVARPWSSSRLSGGERLHLRCDGNAANSFATTQGKDPSSRARRRKLGSSGCVQESRVSSRVETGMSGNFLSGSKGVKDRLHVPKVRWHISASIITLHGYENGDYVKKNLETALFWYSKAVKYGNAEAENDCQRIRRKMKSQ